MEVLEIIDSEDSTQALRDKVVFLTNFSCTRRIVYKSLLSDSTMFVDLERKTEGRCGWITCIDASCRRWRFIEDANQVLVLDYAKYFL